MRGPSDGDEGHGHRGRPGDARTHTTPDPASDRATDGSSAGADPRAGDHRAADPHADPDGDTVPIADAVRDVCAQPVASAGRGPGHDRRDADPDRRGDVTVR